MHINVKHWETKPIFRFLISWGNRNRWFHLHWLVFDELFPWFLYSEATGPKVLSGANVPQIIHRSSEVKTKLFPGISAMCSSWWTSFRLQSYTNSVYTYILRNLTCGFSSIRLTPSTRWERNLALSALLNRDLRTEAICTKQDNTCKQGTAQTHLVKWAATDSSIID